MSGAAARPSARVAGAGLGAALLALALVLLAGCYRIGKPVQLGETVRVVITTNDARLVRAQAFLQSEIAEALQNRLGWRVDPTGSARLELGLAQEGIDATAEDRRGIPGRWSITLTGAVMLVSARGQSGTTYRGVGHASGVVDEPEALRQAARNAAAEIAVWLENTVPQLAK